MPDVVTPSNVSSSLEALEWVHEGHEGDTLIAAPGEQVINITAVTARRKVSGYIGSNVSHMMGGTDPALVFSQGRLVWRVPIVFGTPSQGILGVVGTLDVDVRTGELILPTTLRGQINFRKQIQARAKALLARPSPAPTT